MASHRTKRKPSICVDRVASTVMVQGHCWIYTDLTSLPFQPPESATSTMESSDLLTLVTLKCLVLNKDKSTTFRADPRCTEGFITAANREPLGGGNRKRVVEVGVFQLSLDSGQSVSSHLKFN